MTKKKKLCPRCGDNFLDPIEAMNSLSRRRDKYICNACGTHEAMLDIAGKPPLSKWAVDK